MLDALLSLERVYTIKKQPLWKTAFSGREDKIRTCDPLHPIQVRYRAAPLPEQMGCKCKAKFVFKKIFINIFSQILVFISQLSIALPQIYSACLQITIGFYKFYPVCMERHHYIAALRIDQYFGRVAFYMIEVLYIIARHTHRKRIMLLL